MGVDLRAVERIDLVQLLEKTAMKSTHSVAAVVGVQAWHITVVHVKRYLAGFR